MHGIHRTPWTFIFATVALLAVHSDGAYAQQTGVAVQLPTISSFSVNTSVLAPDSGAGIAAAMRRAEANRIMFGPGPQTAQGRGADVKEVLINPTIHGGENEPNLVLGNGSGVAEFRGAFSRKLDAARGSSAGRADLSVAEIKRLRSQDNSQEAVDAVRYFQRGLAAETKGRLGVAAIYYRQSATRARGDLRTAALERLRAVASKR